MTQKTIAIPLSTWQALRQYCTERPGLTLGQAVADAVHRMTGQGAIAPREAPQEENNEEKPPQKAALPEKAIQSAIPIVELLIQCPDVGRFVSSVSEALGRSSATIRRQLTLMEEHLPFVTYLMVGRTRNYLIRSSQLGAAREWLAATRERGVTPDPCGLCPPMEATP